MRTITRADQDVARLNVKLSERLGEPVDPRVKAIAEMDRSTLPWRRPRATEASTQGPAEHKQPDFVMESSGVAVEANLEPLESPKTDTAEGLWGAFRSHVVTQDGQDVGRIGLVYLDDATGRPTWVGVQHDQQDPDQVLVVPLAGSEPLGDGKLMLAYTREAIETSPVTRPCGHLEQEQLEALVAHYRAGSSPATAAKSSTKRPAST